MAFAHTPVGEICVETDDAERLARRYDRLRTAASDPKTAVELIASAIEDYQ